MNSESNDDDPLVLPLRSLCFHSISRTLFASYSAALSIEATPLCSIQCSMFRIKIKDLDPLRAKKIFIRQAEDGPYLGFGYKSSISDPLRSGKRSQRNIL